MFDRVSDSFNSVFKKLSGNAAITQSNVKEAMDEVRTALLEADVHYEVAEDFCNKIMTDAVGQQVTKSIKPGQEMIGIVHRRLIELFGGDPDAEQQPTPPGIMKLSPGPTIIMMCGLQGSGKTTTCGKLAGVLKKQGRSVMLAAADLQRPAAIEQLETVAHQANTELAGGSQVHFYGEHDKTAQYGKAVGVAVKVCQNALKEARAKGVDVLILDTAGRLHINDELMGELKSIRSMVQPHHIFLVVDAMTGQDAVNSAKAFHQQLEVDGIILTKFDSDTRGGAALSVKQVTGAPIRYIGVGEKLDAIEVFHPERMAGRILGMGDVVSLVEKAQQEVTEDEAAALEAKMAKGQLDMDDFLKQMKMMRRMGSMKSLMGMLPGVGSALKDIDIDEKELDRTEAMIHSMTMKERKKPDLIRHTRKQRIARGSGTDANQVGKLTKQFSMLSKMMKSMGGMGAGGKAALAQQLTGGGGGGGSGMGGMGGFAGFGKGGTKAKSSGIKKRKPKKKR
ncbi:MAG: signal recognition particle protein [Phycisphaerales bacterium]|nr:signal recognition particle protein [Phycisphaerales bacterium]